MPRSNEQQRPGLQRPDDTRQDVTGGRGVEQRRTNISSFPTKEVLIGTGVVLGLGLFTSEAQAQQDEENLDTAPTIGTLDVGPGVLFRTEPTTASSTVQRNRELNTYEVIDIVDGLEVTVNGRTSSDWYHIRIPGDTPRYAYVSGSVSSYTENPRPTATSTPTDTPTETMTPTGTATATPEQADNAVETEGVPIIGRATVKEDAAVVVSNPRAQINSLSNEVLYRPSADTELQVLSAITNGIRIGDSRTWFEVILPEEALEELSPTATPTPTPTRPSSGRSYPTRIVNGVGEVAVGYIPFSDVNFRRIANPTIQATPTVTEEVIPISTATPVEIAQVPTETPEGVSIAALPSTSIDLPNDMLLPVDVVRERAPRTYRWSMSEEVNIQGSDGVIRRETRIFDTRTIRIVPENIGTIIDIHTNPIQHGVYSPSNPPPIRPELLPQPQNINGRMAEYGYVVGIFSFGVSPSGSDGTGAITFFAEGTNTPVHVEFKMDEMFNNVSIGVQDSNGSEVGTPADNRGRISVGNNPATNLLINYENRTLTIPTDNGPLVIHEGDEIMLAILWNQEISNYARHWGDQMPSEWSETVFDNDPNNDPQNIFVEQMGLIVSDRPTQPN